MPFYPLNGSKELREKGWATAKYPLHLAKPEWYSAEHHRVRV